MNAVSLHSPFPFNVRVRFLVALRRFLGMLLTLNFAVLWIIPILVQGRLFHAGLHRFLRPVHGLLDHSVRVRHLAKKYVYRRAVHADYFASAIFIIVCIVLALAVVFTWQISFGELPWWLVVAYYFVWVGFGGRGMATVYTLAHREGHVAEGRMYRPWIAKHIGNIFENRIGLWYGIVPHTFSTSHILLHHRLNGGKSDPIYVWDLDRTKFGDLLLYQWRIFMYTAGFGNIREFRRQQDVHPAIRKAHARLSSGMRVYWVYVPAALVALLVATGSSISSSLLFLFFIYIQPLFAMSTFLALITLAQHGFLEYDEKGRTLKHVVAITILNGHDDSFGEDDHRAHHYSPSVTHDKLAATQSLQESECARCHGSVFKNTSIIEIAILLLSGRIDRLIDRYYVDYSGGRLERDQIVRLFTRRAQRKEMSYEEYEFRYLPTLRDRVRDHVKQGMFKNENHAYLFQAQHEIGPEFRAGRIG